MYNMNVIKRDKGEKIMLTTLFLIFLVLKLCGVIAWAWIYVFLPLIVEVAIGVIAVIIAFILALKD